MFTKGISFRGKRYALHEPQSVFMTTVMAVVASTMMGVFLIPKYQQESWPSVEGKFVSGSVIRGQGKRRSSGLDCEYTYVVNGGQYSADTISRMSYEDAKAMLASFESGTPPTVYYSPSDPWQSTLAPGLPDWLYPVGAGFALVFWLAAGRCWYLFIRHRRAGA